MQEDLLYVLSYLLLTFDSEVHIVDDKVFAVYSNKSLKNVQKDATLKLKQKYGTVPVNALFGQTLMEEVCWNFRIGQFDDQKLFYQALKMYNEEVQKKPFTFEYCTKSSIISPIGLFKITYSW